MMPKRLPVVIVVTLAAFATLGAHASRAAEVMRSAFPVRTAHHQCFDVMGARVSMIRFDGLRDVAHAVIMNRVPYIVLNPTRLATLPPPLQDFFYEHECAHHVLGHNYNPTLASESEADCLAIKVGRAKGYFSRKDVIAFGPWIRPLHGSRFGHLPGRQRQKLLLMCFDNVEAEKDAELSERVTAALARVKKGEVFSRQTTSVKRRR